MIDFGVARAFGRVAHTSPGGLKGKIDYMSPEQASAEEVDHRADVFALGVVLWEALTGRRLFRRETELATMRAIVDDPIPHPSEIAPSIPAELDAIVMRALRKRKDARFASAQEMAVALERFAFSNDGFSPDAGRRLHEVAVRGRVPAVAEDRDGGAGPGGGEAAAGRSGDGGHRRRTADGRADDGVAAGRLVAGRPQRDAQRQRPQPQPQQPQPGPGQRTAGQPERVQSPALGRRPGGRDGRRRGAQARSHLAVRRRRRAAGHRRRRRLDADAAPGDLGRWAASRPRPPPPAAMSTAIDKLAPPAPAPQPAVARTPAPTSGAGWYRARRAGRAVGRDPGFCPRARARLRVLEGAVPSGEVQVEQRVTNVPAPARRPKRPTATTRTRRRAPTSESQKADPFAD